MNFPIVLLSRYREFRARGMAPESARRDAVWNAFRAELVGASVAAIAYGSLTITRFRGFAQFGLIGLVGMMLVWISMIPCVPAMIAAVERLEGALPRRLRQAPARVEPDGSRGPLSRLVGDITERRPRLVLAIAGAITIVAVWRLPAFLRDPWEYDFDKLGSSAARAGMDAWTRKAERVFGGRAGLGGAMMIADTAAQVPALKARILANDAADPEGRLIEEITTLDDVLPGSEAEQRRKLGVIARIQGRLTPAVLAALPEAERRRVEEERPPAGLRVVGPGDLPPVLRHRFEEASGAIGAVFHVRFRDVSLTDGHNLLRIARTTDDVALPDGQRVATASRSTVFAEMIRSMQRDAPLATLVALSLVVLVVAAATRDRRGTVAVLLALLLGVAWMLGGAAWRGERINFVDFIALPITFGIGAEYPFNIYDRSRLLAGDVTRAVKLHAGAVALCSYTTVIGYGSLVGADNLALRSFGRMAVAGEIACLFAALVFLPALLHATRPARAKEP